jgi:spore coat polysaccharide biosynthesis protein SpsF
VFVRNKKKICCIIEARMTSNRLRGKVLKKLDKNNYLIDYVISNIINSKHFDASNTILASPTNKINDELCNYVKKKYNLNIYRGSEENVFERVHDCSNLANFEANVRYTADNPFVDPLLINQFVDFFLENNIDYLSTRTMNHTKKWKLASEYPEGLSIEIYKSKLLNEIAKYVNKKNMDYPTWNLYSGPKKYFLKGFKLIKSYKKKKLDGLRVTVDTQKDLHFIRELIKKFGLKPGRNNFLKILNLRNKIKFNLFNYNKQSKIAYKVISMR